MSSSALAANERALVSDASKSDKALLERAACSAAVAPRLAKAAITATIATTQSSSRVDKPD